MGRLGCLLIIAAIGGITVGIRTLMVASRATPEPVHITAAQLTYDQIDTNPHVVIDDVFVCSLDAIIGKSDHKPAAWMPAIAATPEFAQAVKDWRDRRAPLESFPRPPGVRLLIKTSDTSDDHLLGLAGKKSIQGMLVKNDLGMIKGFAMQKSYPGLNTSSCIMLHEGAQPPTASSSIGTFALAGALLIGGIALLLLPRRGGNTPTTPPPTLPV